MTTQTTTTTILQSEHIKIEPEKPVETIDSPPILDERFAKLKRSIISDDKAAAVTESYERLKLALEKEADRVAAAQQSAIPEISWAEVQANGGVIPPETAALARTAGCIVFRSVVSPAQAQVWKDELTAYTVNHPGVGGFPAHDPVFWGLYWTKPQVEGRSHPEVLAAMKATGKLWNIKDESLPIDLDSQAVYADRFRIRKAGDKAFTLKAHLDSSSIERWEDPLYRSNYQAILDGDWESYDPWCMDNRPNAKIDLYGKGGCSAFRALQGWLSLSNCGPGEGTVRLLPSVKLSTAYIMLRPFFLNEKFDASEATFPGSTPGDGQFRPTTKWHPHLQQERMLISAPQVGPGDYLFWHSDVVHEVESEHNGTEDSIVFYNASTPLCPYNVESMIHQRQSFRDGIPPPDFIHDFGGPKELEGSHKDTGAKVENILSLDGKRALGLADFDLEEPGLTEGQKKIRKMANEMM